MAATQSNPVILYDIPSKFELRAWSPNMWRVRLALNYRRIPYRTQWIDYPDIKSTFIELGFKPTGKDWDGSPLYTCPAIIDPTTPERTFVADSIPIVEYLETAYPPSQFGPTLFPDGTRDKQTGVINQIVGTVSGHIIRLLLPSMPNSLESARGAEYFSQTREKRWGYPLCEMCPAGSESRKETWDALKKGLDGIAELYDRNVEGKGDFLIGDSITYAEVVLEGILGWTKDIPDDRDGESVEYAWQLIAPLNGGRWVRLLKKFEDYRQVL